MFPIYFRSINIKSHWQLLAVSHFSTPSPWKWFVSVFAQFPINVPHCPRIAIYIYIYTDSYRFSVMSVSRMVRRYEVCVVLRFQCVDNPMMSRKTAIFWHSVNRNGKMTLRWAEAENDVRWSESVLLLVEHTKEFAGLVGGRNQTVRAGKHVSFVVEYCYLESKR